jgi:hypothetical protein
VTLIDSKQREKYKYYAAALRRVQVQEFKPRASVTTEYLQQTGFEVFTAATMKNAVFWEITPCVLQEPTFWINVSPPSSG